MNTPRLGDFRRIVVKVGSSLLVDAAAGRLNESWLTSLADRPDLRMVLVGHGGPVLRETRAALRRAAAQV